MTGNAAKADYLKRFCDYPFDHHAVDLPEIQSLDLQEIVEAKAKTAHAILKKPVLVEDVSLVFNALGSLPGPLIKWFLKTLGNAGMAQLVSKYKDRSAVASVCYCLYDGKTAKFFRGSANGRIASEPKGDPKFGWNPIFIPDGQADEKNPKTWAQMTDQEIETTAMRTKPLKDLKKYLNSK